LISNSVSLILASLTALFPHTYLCVGVVGGGRSWGLELLFSLCCSVYLGSSSQEAVCEDVAMWECVRSCVCQAASTLARICITISAHG